MSLNDGESPGRPDDDVLDSRTADVLRLALTREAAQVKPAGDGLARIQARTHGSPGRARSGWLLPVAAAAVSIAVVSGVGWAAMNPDEGNPAASPGPAPNGPSATAEVPSGPIPAASAEGTHVAIPVYYVAEQPGGDGTTADYRLFREFHAITASEPDRVARIEIALDEMLANAPLDPDYRAASWPTSTQVGGVTVDAETDVVTVDLVGINPAKTEEVATLDEQRGAATVQELVFTVTAAASYDGFQAAGVQITLDGARSTEIYGVDISEPLQRDTAPYRAELWVLSMDDGATLTNPVMVGGEAKLAESGSGRWLVTQGGATVAEGSFETERCCAFARFDFEVPQTLLPGNYVLTVYDAAAGDVDSSPYDSKAFNVEGPN